MLSDAALRSIADNLAALNLDPVAYLRVAVAVVGQLMGDHASDRVEAPAAPKPNGAGNGAHRPRTRAARPQRRNRRAPGEAITRARAALDRAPGLGMSALAERASVSRRNGQARHRRTQSQRRGSSQASASDRA
jgi:hypothetical protein